MNNKVDQARDILHEPVKKILALEPSQDELDEVVKELTDVLRQASQRCVVNLMPNTDLCIKCEEPITFEIS